MLGKPCSSKRILNDQMPRIRVSNRKLAVSLLSTRFLAPIRLSFLFYSFEISVVPCSQPSCVGTLLGLPPQAFQSRSPECRVYIQTARHNAVDHAVMQSASPQRYSSYL